jgi:hypothetical protein
MLSPTDESNDRYDGVRAYLAGLPHDQCAVELRSAQIEELIGRPLPPEVSDPAWVLDPASALSRSCRQAEFGLIAVMCESDGVVLCLGRGLHRFPGVYVDSGEFGKLPADERLRKLAIGYLESGKVLSIHLGNNPVELTWPRMAPAWWCYWHALELFIKSCILHREPVERCDHNIGGLVKQYARLYPGVEFRFHRMPDLRELEESLGGPFADVEEFERKPDQVFRYLSDKQGRSPKGVYGASPASCLSLLEQLEHDIARIWGRIEIMDSKA